MIGDIRKHLDQRPLVPFTIHMAAGWQIRALTRDHVFLVGGRAIATLNNEDYDILPSPLTSGFKMDTSVGGVARLP